MSQNERQQEEGKDDFAHLKLFERVLQAMTWIVVIMILCFVAWHKMHP
jgi:hypothetical protein